MEPLLLFVTDRKHAKVAVGLAWNDTLALRSFVVGSSLDGSRSRSLLQNGPPGAFRVVVLCDTNFFR